MRRDRKLSYTQWTCRAILLTLAAAALYGSVGAGCSANSSEVFNSPGVGGSGEAGATGEGGSGTGGTLADVIIVPETGGPSGGAVPQSCSEAEQNKSYIGCEYWPTMTPNSSLYEGFQFAIVVSNPTTKEASVKVERGGSGVADRIVAPGAVETIMLPWVAGLKQTSTGTQQPISGIVKGGAYKVTSSVPVVVYQFNPLEFQLDPAPSGCPDPNGVGCFSYSNDASLLLPTTALRNEYYGMSWPTHHFGNVMGWMDTPGFLVVTGVVDGTTVTVKTAAFVRAGGVVGAMSPGAEAQHTLNAGDVLVLASGALPAGKTAACSTDPSGYNFCKSPPQYDLTGTKITADKPIGVLGGHDCTFIPYDKWACDHIEESMFPVETLGQDLVVTAPHAVAAIGKEPGKADTMFVRVMSAADNNEITFDPPVHDPVTLQAGGWIEIGPIAQDFRVQAANRVMVAQFMVGENFTGASVGAGDPSQSIAIPTEQYRLNYAFLAPTTYTHNFVNVVAPPDANIEIDGEVIDSGEFKPIGSSGLSVARHKIEGGAHTMSGNKNFGIVVYGYGSYTSYMYPGGLNLETVTIIPK